MARGATLRWTDGTGTSRWTAPPTLAREPVLKMGPSGFLLHRAKARQGASGSSGLDVAPGAGAGFEDDHRGDEKNYGLSSYPYRYFSGSGPLPGGPGHVLAAPSAVQRRVVSRQVAEIQDVHLPHMFGYAIAVSRSSCDVITSGCVSSFIDLALK